MQKVLSLVKFYTTEDNVTGYLLTKKTSFLICNQDLWRAHEDQLFKYCSGSWNQKENLSFDEQDILIAAEGLFIRLAEDTELLWKWDSVTEKLTELMIGERDEDLIENFTYTAKVKADYAKTITKNKCYQAHWTLRVCDLVKQLRKDLDTDECMKAITKIYLETGQTKKPQS